MGPSFCSVNFKAFLFLFFKRLYNKSIHLYLSFKLKTWENLKMEFILSLIKEPFLFVYSVLVQLNFYLINNLRHLDQSFPDFVAALRFLKLGLYIYAQVFELFLVFRLVIYWLPGFNPYIPPFYLVLATTDPIIRAISKRLPRILGLDLSFLLLSFGLSYFIKILADFKF